MNFFGMFGKHAKPMKPGDFSTPEAKAAAAWLETVNPLRGMTAQKMQNLYDASRSGDTVHLQWLYQEIEKVDPTILICQQRRTGALAALDWTIKTRNQRRTRGFDTTLAQEQADCLEMAFGDADQTNFNDAVEHLARGFFRGFSHVLPRWSEDGLSLKGFDCLDQWNFVRDNATGTWYWNPEAHAYTGLAGLRPIPQGELVVFCAPYHIDYPAMSIYLRAAVGEQGWAKFVERFGIPPVILTMPNDIPNDQVDAWRQSAEKVAEGGSGAVPFGTTVNFCDGARGINPFKDFIHNQRELVVLMSTGGLLTSLTEAGSGTLAGGAHSDTWAEVRRMDSAKVGSVLNRTLADAILDRAFPGRPHIAYFAFDTDEVKSPGEVFDDATKAKAAGYLIDQADLEERTGYKLVRDETSVSAPGGSPFMNREANKSKEKVGGESRSTKDGEIPLSTSTSSLLSSFARDTGPAAEAVAKLLQNPSKEAAEQLLADLPSLIPDDPALAAVIADEMAKAMAAELSSTHDTSPDGRARSPSAPLSNAEGVCTSPNGPAGCKSPTCPGANDLSQLKDDQGDGLEEAQKKSLLKGHASIEKVLEGKADVLDAMDDPELGSIDFRWDAHGFGIKHIIERRDAYRANGHPDAISGEDMVRMIPSVIARGERKFVGKGLRRDVEIDFKGLHVVLTPSLRGKHTNHWVMTGYDINPEAAGYRK